jgi:hypothetical protein
LLLCFATYVLTVLIAYWSFFGIFAWKLSAFKAELHSFSVCTIADLAKFIFPCDATCLARRANPFLHFGALLTSDTANTNFHDVPLKINQLGANIYFKPKPKTPLCNWLIR